jgi:hypothetical protein
MQLIIRPRNSGKTKTLILKSAAREERKTWFENHDTLKDKICKENCLDVCIDYNNKWREYHATYKSRFL